MYVPKNKPWAHQKTALNRLKGKSVFAILMAMRTGKSYVTTTDFCRLEYEKKVDDLLIIAPAGVYRTWEVDIKKHASDDFLKRAKLHVWSADHTSNARKDALASFLKWRKGPRVLLVNIEALSSVDRSKALVKDFASQRRCYGAIDESTTIKNIDSKRSEFVTEKLAPLLVYKRILSGLPTPRSPLDLYGQFLFLDKSILGFENWVAFQSRYADIVKICLEPSAKLVGMLRKRVGDKINMPGVGNVDVDELSRNEIIQELQRLKVYIPTIPKLKGYMNEDELMKKIAPHSFRVRLEDCYDMPPKTYAIREVELTKNQRRIYDEMVEMATSELKDKDYVTAESVITKILKLHQILCGHTKDENGKEHFFEENRTKEVLSILREYDGKAIIWCSYDADIQKVATALQKEYGPGSVARFWGGNRSKRENEEKKFLTDSECRFMIATPAAGGRGRTWTVANLLIYYSSTNNLEHRSQSEERASGNEKKDFINCIDIVAPGTVDEKILQALRSKIDMAAAITGDNWREWVV